MADQAPAPEDSDWTGGARVRARRIPDGFEFRINEVTSQARVYKQLLDRFLRTDFKVRPRWGAFEVEIGVDIAPGLPTIDLDNVAKAVLDGIKGAVFFDDGQVWRLVVEKRFAASEQVTVRAVRRPDGGGEGA
jgi:crossover junction endodeoxyribonuclease RusA